MQHQNIGSGDAADGTDLMQFGDSTAKLGTEYSIPSTHQDNQHYANKNENSGVAMQWSSKEEGIPVMIGC